MKNININKGFKTICTISFALVFLISLNSCSKDFIDEPEDTSGATYDIIFESKDNAQTFVNGILSNYKGQYLDRPDAGGLYSMYFARAVKGNDLIQSNSIYAFDYGHENRESGYARTNFTWDFNYESVNFANMLIEGVNNSPTISEDDKIEFIAMGKFFRGFHLFELLLEFAPNYNNDRNLVRIPMYTKPTTLQTITGNPPLPMSDVYNQVIQDLEDAIEDLPVTRLGKSFVNKDVAKAILVRVLSVTSVNQAENDWDKVSTLAKSVYGGDASLAVQSTNWGTGFNDMEDDEWIWAMYQNGSDESNFYWGHAAVSMDHYTLSYSATYIDPSFVSQFSATDIRNTFVDLYNVSSTEPWREFVSRKYAFSFASDIPILRKSEMVLFDAEAQYHLGNIPEAQNLLYALQMDRDPNAIKSNSTGQALLNEILLERKKEFYGEFGPQWFDAKRYNLPILRSKNHRIQINVPADTNFLFLKIPQVEMQLNPFYKGFNNE